MMLYIAKPVIRFGGCGTLASCRFDLACLLRPLRCEDKRYSRQPCRTTALLHVSLVPLICFVLIMSPSTNNVRSRQTQPATRSRMSALFNTIRASIYGLLDRLLFSLLLIQFLHPGSVLLFTVICLAMAGHFQTVLAASDLSENKRTFLGLIFC